MRLHRFFVGYNNFRITTGETHHFSNTALAHQLKSVFRFHPGSQAIFFDGSGSEHVSEIVSLSKDETVIRLLETREVAVFSPVSLTLALSVIKKDNTEFVVEKCTELGVDVFVPLVSERSEKKSLDFDRLNKKVIEATEQSGRAYVPEISPLTSLEEFLDRNSSSASSKPLIVFHTDGEVWDADAIQEYSAAHKEITVCIGPEGGWSPKEIELCKQKGALVVKLNTPVLRAETASIAIATLFLVS